MKALLDAKETRAKLEHLKKGIKRKRRQNNYSIKNLDSEECAIQMVGKSFVILYTDFIEDCKIFSKDKDGVFKTSCNQELVRVYYEHLPVKSKPKYREFETINMVSGIIPWNFYPI